MEQHSELFCAKVKHGRCITREASIDAVVAHAKIPLWPEAVATFTNAQRQAIATGVFGVVAGGASYIAVTAENLVVE